MAASSAHWQHSGPGGARHNAERTPAVITGASVKPAVARPALSSSDQDKAQPTIP
jgi:hypothetical protein